MGFPLPAINVYKIPQVAEIIAIIESFLIIPCSIINNNIEVNNIISKRVQLPTLTVFIFMLSNKNR